MSTYKRSRAQSGIISSIVVVTIVGLGWVCSNAALAQITAGAPVVRVQQGELAGVVTPSKVLSFKDIPFAAPPVGDLRWRPPVEPEAWSGVRQATAFGAACMQNLQRDRAPWTKEFMVQNEDSEDCLFLNVWTPSLKPDRKLPVLVFIHGGGFTEGSGGIDAYNGENLAKKGMVVVTINYRLGVFGFLVHPDLCAESSNHRCGDYGLLDQIAALKWLRQNVASFGGDSGKVTIWGQSAGAISVGALIASPLAKGLFRGAMADSGLSHSSALTKSVQDAETEGLSFAKNKGAASIKELRATPATDLMTSIRFPLVIDGWILPDTAAKLMDNDPDADVPLITGYQSEDGRSLGRAVQGVEEYQQRVQSMYGQFSGDLLKLYPADSDGNVNAVWEEMGRDKNRVSMYLFASNRSKTHRSRTYTYFFDQAIPWPQHPEFGAFHTSELVYLFGNLQQLDRPWAEKDRQVSRLTSQYVTNFVATGSPNGGGVPEWQPVETTPKTMELGKSFGALDLAKPQREALWMKILTSIDPSKVSMF